MTIPLFDLRATWLPIRERLAREWDEILDGMELFLGPHTRAFEAEFAAYCDVEQAITVGNGTEALFAALLACGVGPGDEVVCPSHTFFATIEAVLQVGATPVLADVEPDTLTIDPAAVASAVTDETRAILPVHLYGNPADMDPLLEIAGERGLVVIEDAAQAVGARYKGRRVGTLGDAGTFSFYFTKNLGAFGEGGCVTTTSPDVADRVRALRHHGHVSKFEHATLGYNLRMDELQAAVLRLKLPDLDERNARRGALAARYRELLAEAPVRVLRTREDCESVHHVQAIRAPDRDRLRDHLESNGIGTGIHYRTPGHRQKVLRGRPHRVGSMKVTEAACAELLSIPLYPELSDEQLEQVATAVVDFYRG